MSSQSPPFDKQDQYDKIVAGIIAGERIDGVFDLAGGGTGYVGLTDRRLIVADEGRLTRRRALVSFPWRQLAAIAVDTTGDGRLSYGELTLTTSAGQTIELRFKHAERARAVYAAVIERAT